MAICRGGYVLLYNQSSLFRTLSDGDTVPRAGRVHVTVPAAAGGGYSVRDVVADHWRIAAEGSMGYVAQDGG